MKTCSVQNCQRKHLAKGFCLAHYQRWKKTGSTSPEMPISTCHEGSRNPHWKGGVSKDRERVKIHRPDHPYANKQGYVYRYRLVMEERLGRYLTEKEIVHHRDENESNDDPSNLEVIDQTTHINLHRNKMKTPVWREKLMSRQRDNLGRYA